MELDLSNEALVKFLLKLQMTWRKNVNMLYEDDKPSPIDLSPTEASISRLISNQEQYDKDAFLREWAAFLGPGPNGHLATSAGTVAGEQVAQVVRREAAMVNLPRMAGAFIQYDAPAIKIAQPSPAAPINETKQTVGTTRIYALTPGQARANNNPANTSDDTVGGTSSITENGNTDGAEDGEGQNQDGGEQNTADDGWETATPPLGAPAKPSGGLAGW